MDNIRIGDPNTERKNYRAEAGALIETQLAKRGASSRSLVAQ
jgi:hypothetical protein